MKDYLGQGFPELGSVSIQELANLNSPSQLRFLEQDKYFEANKPLSEYTQDAYKKGYIDA